MTTADAQSQQPPSSRSSEQLVGDRLGLRSFLSVLIQLGLLVSIVRQFQLESPLFYQKIMPLAFFGFLIHYFLPQRHRLSFFIALSFVGIHAALGFPNSLWLIGLGLLLVSVCHLPVPFVARAALILAIAACLALLRMGRLEAAWADSVVPILASMFMFRIIIYLYDLRNQKRPVNIRHTLAYFFMLPNVAFPLFPTVDFSTFRRTYYDSDQHAIHQKGIRWMLAGIIQLLIYRYIHYYWVVAPEDVTNLPRLLQHAAADYLLILRLTGQYTLIVGMLVLFGFNLPAVVERFLLASSFTDYWRRANIYWRDFLQKIFFYPVYFRLRSVAPTPRLVISILVGFVVTWFFHAYQWFWIRGSFLLSLPDFLFWAALAVCVTATAVYESKRGPRQALGDATFSLRGAVSRALRAMLLFAMMAVLWSLWTSPSVADWFYLWRDTDITIDGIISVIPMLLLAFAVFFAAILLFERAPQLGTDAAGSSAGVPLFRRAGVTVAASVFLYLLGTPIVAVQGNREAPEIVRALQGTRLNEVETELLTRGYYETMNASNQFTNTNLWELYLKKSKTSWPPFRETEAGLETATFLRDEVRPSVSLVFHGAPLSTNRWGMRDQEYELEKPDDVYRIAVLGGSTTFGSGVENNETFEALLEDRLNAENPGEYAKYEILNFSIPGHCVVQHLALLESKVVSFEPDAVLLIATSREDNCSAHHLAMVMAKGIEIPYEFLRQIVRKARVDSGTPFEQGFRRLKRYGEEILRETYPRVAKLCQERGIVPAYAYTPIVQDNVGERDFEEDAHFMSLAKQAGFLVLDVSDAYAGQDAASLRVAPWDWHPNVLGHKLLADRLFRAFRQNEERLGLKLNAGEGVSRGSLR